VPHRPERASQQWRSARPKTGDHIVLVLPLYDAAGAKQGIARGVNRLAVVGGTGAYAGARGTITSTDTSDGATDVLNLLP
jgi:hypothetical protein